MILVGNFTIGRCELQPIHFDMDQGSTAPGGQTSSATRPVQAAMDTSHAPEEPPDEHDRTQATEGNRAKLVAFDTAHLGDMARDWSSRRAAERQAASGFVSTLFRLGWVPVLSWHHLDELLKHHRIEVASDRLKFIRSLPAIAWVRSAADEILPGAVVDILAWEAKAATEVTGDGALEVRDRAATHMLAFGTGDEAVAWFVDGWEVLRPFLWAREARSREIVAISRSTVMDEMSLDRVTEWLRSNLNEPTETTRKSQELHELLSQEIKNSGDRRIPNAEDISARFFEDVFDSAAALRSGGASPVRQYLRSIGIDEADITLKTTMEDVTDLARHRKRLRLVSDAISTPYERLKSEATLDRIPSCIIQKGMEMHRQRHREHKGSDLTDAYLACLAPYVDICFVDKRTHENVIRAKRKSPLVTSLAQSVQKLGYYKDAVEHLCAQ